MILIELSDPNTDIGSLYLEFTHWQTEREHMLKSPKYFTYIDVANWLLQKFKLNFDKYSTPAINAATMEGKRFMNLWTKAGYVPGAGFDNELSYGRCVRPGHAND